MNFSKTVLLLLFGLLMFAQIGNAQDSTGTNPDSIDIEETIEQAQDEESGNKGLIGYIIGGIGALLAAFGIYRSQNKGDTEELEKEIITLGNTISNLKNQSEKQVASIMGLKESVEEKQAMLDNSINATAVCKMQLNDVTANRDFYKDSDESKAKLIAIMDKDWNDVRQALENEKSQSETNWNVLNDTLKKYDIPFDHKALLSFVRDQNNTIEQAEEVINVWFPLGRETEGKTITGDILNKYFNSES